MHDYSSLCSGIVMVIIINCFQDYCVNNNEITLNELLQ